MPLPDRLRSAKNPVRKMIVGVRIEVSPCFPPTAPAACIAGARLSMPRTRISGNEATRATAPVANIAAFRPTLAATASIATGATAVPRKPAKVWIEKARPSRTGAICAERIA
jgi:hypothetical protein